MSAQEISGLVSLVLIGEYFQDTIVNIFLSISFNMCFGCSKETSHRQGSFEHPQHRFWMRNKKNNFQICSLLRPVSHMRISILTTCMNSYRGARSPHFGLSFYLCSYCVYKQRSLIAKATSTKISCTGSIVFHIHNHKCICSMISAYALF